MQSTAGKAARDMEYPLESAKEHSVEEYEIEIVEGQLGEWLETFRGKPGEVVMAILRPGERVLLITKDFYPPGTYRMPTGGIHQGETPEEALVREAKEETGFAANIERKLGAIHWVFRSGDRTLEYYSHVFLISETADEPVAEDENERITGYKEVSICDLREVAQELINLPGRWRDWGRFRGMVHDFVYSALCPGAEKPDGC
jgi:8-oxo-dGTP pyrophosphatase MutT (NUDIX family)